MARSVRDTKLDSRDARLKLKHGRRYFREIGDGVALCYRRTGASFGTWAVRLRGADGKYALRSLEATADDHEAANGANVLSYFQAQEKARREVERWRTEAGIVATPTTARKATEHYLEWFRKHRRSTTATEATIKAHILPALGDKLAAKLTAKDIRDWHEALASAPAKLRTGKLAAKANIREAKSEDAKRARRATANRVLTVLKAILNRAFHDGLVPDDTEWRKVKPFAKADEARIRFLDDAEATRLANACGADLRVLVRGALLTGARLGELAGMHAHDVNLDGARVYIAQSKSGKPRHIPLNAEGVALFRGLVTGKTGEALVFTRANGSAWGKNYHVRPLAAACKVAKIRPPIAFHELRHTFASHLAQAGVDLLTISKLLGHADTRITSKHYAHLTDRGLALAVEKLPNFGTDHDNRITPMRKSA